MVYDNGREMILPEFVKFKSNEDKQKLYNQKVMKRIS